jgi:RNA polymerase sigma factor (sigma-70 family)
MRDDLNPLLDSLASGNTEEAARFFRCYEPLLRTVVRQRLDPALRPKFDSVDVVQSVWVDLVRGFQEGRWRFDGPEKFRAFLVTVTRNRFLEWVRHYRPALRLEQPLTESGVPAPPADPQPRPSEVARAAELWERMLELCRPEHRPILHLKRQGLSLDEIAGQTGLHKSSIRRILYDLARQLAAQQH